jgi:hypothetical protein
LGKLETILCELRESNFMAFNNLTEEEMTANGIQKTSRDSFPSIFRVNPEITNTHKIRFLLLLLFLLILRGIVILFCFLLETEIIQGINYFDGNGFCGNLFFCGTKRVKKKKDFKKF